MTLLLYSLIEPDIFLQIFRKVDRLLTGKLIDGLTNIFKSDHDHGPILRTHIYLLVGLSAPIWMSSTLKLKFNLLIGLISIGIGDAAAALVGIYFGRHKWFTTKKTVEGTLACFLSQYISAILICDYLAIEMHHIDALIIFIISSMLETFTNQVDNLVLPLYLNIISLLFSRVRDVFLLL